MVFDYINENLDKILQNPDSVFYINSYYIGNKRAIFAVVKEDEGIYKKVQITKKQSRMEFPWEPLFHFFNEPGYLLQKKFIVFDNWVALNTTHLDGFKYISNKNKKEVGIFATFDDGSATFVKPERQRKFAKQGEIESYINLLKQYKEYNPTHDIYENIEYYNDNSDTFIIPKLQKKNEELPKVKKLTNGKQD